MAVAQVSPYRIIVRYKLGQRTEPEAQSRQRGASKMREAAIVVSAINKRIQRGRCLLALDGKRQVDACASCPVSMSETGGIQGILYLNSRSFVPRRQDKITGRL